MVDKIRRSRMTPKSPTVAVFDPGGLTGFAALDRAGAVLFTTTLSLDALPGFVSFASFLGEQVMYGVAVIVEVGPRWRHNSVVTKRAEAIVTEAFPDAQHVTPSQWKGHPAAHHRGAYSYSTRHEKDCVSLGRWYLATRSDHEVEGQRPDTAREDSEGPRRKRD